MKKICGVWVSSIWHKFSFVQLRIPFIVNKHDAKLANDEGMIILPNGWILTEEYYQIMMYEYDSWKKDYIFPSYIKGKTVFDSGAGAGETAMLFIEKGAKKVICNEINKDALKALQINKDNGKPIEIIDKPFNQQMIVDCKPDFIKMDTEGYGEVELLRNDFIKTLKIPMVIELHSHYFIDRFLEYGLKPIRFITKYKDIGIFKNF